MIDDMLNNKKLNPIVTKLFIRIRKIKISLVFITQSYFTNALPSTDNFKQKLIFDFKNFMNSYKRFPLKRYSFLVNVTTLPSDNPIHFRHNILERL